MKLLFFFAVLLFSVPVFAQSKNDSDWFVKMKRELHLSQSQEKQIVKIDNWSKAKINQINKKNLSSKEADKKIVEIKDERKRKIMNLLDAQQQERWQMILDNVPRRGVTDMPNERTINR